MQAKFTVENFETELLKLKIDIFISSSSFEERCFVIPNLKHRFTKSYYFYNINEDNSIIINTEKLCEISENSEKVQLNSDLQVENFLVISDLLLKIALDNKQPSILIDITTFTHETLSVIIKLIELHKVNFGRVYLAYVGADCYSVNENDDADKWLSKGIKNIRTVLGYSGLSDPTQANHLVILFGFESERTEQIIQAYEYEYVSLGFANVESSIQTNHQKINYQRHEKMLSDHPNADSFSFSLIDPYQAKRDISKHLSKDEFKNLNTVIAPLNNKLSTVGACLAAIENENIQLAYAKPLVYNVQGYSRPNNDIYCYELNFDSKG